MWEDFYNEGPSDFDIAIEEFKEGLRKTVKEEILKEMARLKKENEELQDVKKNWEQIQIEYQFKEERFNRGKSEIEREIARKKIEELLKAAQWSDKIYCIDTVFGYVPICGKCDNREIHFTSPSGKDMTEPCPVCGKYWCKHVVKEVPCFKLRFSNDPYIKCEGYFVRREQYGDSTTYSSQNIYDGTAEEFDENSYNKYNTAFTSKELAQQICDKINKDSGVPDNLEIKE